MLFLHIFTYVFYNWHCCRLQVRPHLIPHYCCKLAEKKGVADAAERSFTWAET